MGFLCAVFVFGVSGLAITGDPEKSAMIHYESRIKEYLNPYVIGAYFFFLDHHC